MMDTDNHTLRVGTPLPFLVASFPAGQLQLSWPQTPTGFDLETSASLVPTAEWTRIQSGIVSDGHQWH